MIIELSRVYRIEYDGTAAEFIELVDRKSEGLDSLDMGDAVQAATDLYDGGDLTSIVDISDTQYNYIDCPDKNTLLHYFPDADSYQPTKAGVDYVPVRHTAGWCKACGTVATQLSPKSPWVILHTDTCPEK